MSYGIQMAQISGLKNDLKECCVRLKMRMDLISNRLQQAVSQGFPPETARNYSTTYLSPGKTMITEFIDTVQGGHGKYLDNIFKELDILSKLQS